MNQYQKGYQNPITNRQRQVLDVIVTHLLDKGYAPTLREIGTSMKINSTNGVSDHLRALERKGWIRVAEMQSRGITLTEKAKTDYYLEPISPLERRALEEVQDLIKEFPYNLTLGTCSDPVDGAEKVIDKLKGILQRAEMEA